MAKAPFIWPSDGSGAILQQHSVAKLDVLREYLIAYFQTLVTAPGQEEVRLTLVDGFAGGGVFRHADTQQRILGSPLVFLKASEQAQNIINAQRNKPVRFAIAYIFVEKDRSAIASLRPPYRPKATTPGSAKIFRWLRAPLKQEAKRSLPPSGNEAPK
jgi:three-Cys-motif partner protein